MKLDKDKKRGIIGTILFHLILVISLVFLALRTPLPLPGEEGVEVNLGYDETGSGNIQSPVPPPQKQSEPEQQKEKMPKQPPPEPQKAKEVQQQEDKTLTQNIEETPVVEPHKKKPEKIEPEKKKPVEKKKEITKEPAKKEVKEKKKPAPKPKPVINRKALFKGTKNRKGTGTNQGAGKEPGDQGKPHGFENSNKYDGQGGKGNGPAYDLGGRGAKYLDKPPSSFPEAGTIVVSIWVDRSGKVVKALIKEKGTTIIDSGLRRIAIDAALNSTFVADPEAAELQRGTITYNFIR
jgi:hypothetical protein